MELYTLDPTTLRRVEVFDRFESLIWTERYSSAGDFELVTRADNRSRSLLTAGAMITVNNSYSVCKIEEVEDKEDSEGRALLSVKGPSLESVLDNRSTYAAGAGFGNATTWTITGQTPNQIVQTIFDAICVNNTKTPSDNLPLYKTGNLFEPDTLGFPTDIVASFDVPTDTLYSIFTQLSQAYGFGYRLYRGLDDQSVYFNVYMGNDRTSGQEYYPTIAFSPDLDTLAEVGQLTSLTNTKNIAYVFHPNGSVVVTLNDADPAVMTGFDRRVLNVDASDIDSTLTGTALTAALLQRGKDELLARQALHAIDGQVPQTTSFIYNVDYGLGDLVEMRTDDGNKSLMRVTEHISVSDDQGDRSYPTLAENQFVVPGSWQALDAALEWDNIGPTVTWDQFGA